MDIKVKQLVYSALLTALVCVATFMIKVPSINGYTHLGDCMIFISVIILGTRKGALAGGTGAALADLLGGYSQWVLPTFFIKAIMALVMGTITEKLFPKFKYGWVLGAIIGGILQIIGYTLVKIPMYGMAYAIAGLPVVTLQTLNGIVIALVIVASLSKSGILRKFVGGIS